MKAIVLLSGGIDSLAAAHLYQENGYNVQGVFFDYGQPAREPEYQHAKIIADALGLPLKTYTLPDLSIKSDGEIAGRNALLIFQTFALEKYSSYKIILGIHDGTDYPDCSQLFVDKINHVLDLYAGGTIACEAPFVNFEKREIIQYAIDERLPIELTYSCENGSNPPCGKCLSCLDRKEWD